MLNARPPSLTLDGINGQSFPAASSINVFHVQVRKFLPNAFHYGVCRHLMMFLNRQEKNQSVQQTRPLEAQDGLPKGQ